MITSEENETNLYIERECDVDFKLDLEDTVKWRRNYAESTRDDLNDACGLLSFSEPAKLV